MQRAWPSTSSLADSSYEHRGAGRLLSSQGSGRGSTAALKLPTTMTVPFLLAKQHKVAGREVGLDRGHRQVSVTIDERLT